VHSILFLTAWQASQMQGFFGKPVDNLFAEPLIARWIRINVPGWRDAVVVSKNAGGNQTGDLISGYSETELWDCHD